MTKKLFRNAVLFLSLVLSGFFLNSCADLTSEIEEEISVPRTAEISFAIFDSTSDTEARTALPNPDEHDLKKYLYLYNYTLTCVDGNSGEEIIICNDFSYDKFRAESTIRLAIGHTYKFTLKAKDGAVTRMEGSSTIDLGLNPSPQTVTIVLVPAGDEYGQKLRVDWIVPDDGIITTMRAGISSERGHAEFQTESEILVPKYKFQEYAFSVVPNPFPVGDSRRIDNYREETVKRIGITYDNVKTGVSRWLDYKFYDANGILVYESSESVYMIGGKTSSTVIYITPDHYYRRPVTISVKKGTDLWSDNPDLKLKLKDKDGHEYIFKPVVGVDGKTLTGEFEGILPGASSGEGSAEATDGIFDIYVALEKNDGSENDDFIETGAKYNANDGSITGNGSTDAVELVTVPVPQKGVTLTPTAGVVGSEGGLIVPAGKDFTVKVKLDLGYGATGPITIGGKTVGDDGTVKLNAADNASDVTGVTPINYSIDYISKGLPVGWKSGHEPVQTFNIESPELRLPEEADFKDAYQDFNNEIGGWWFGTGTEENNLDNIIHKINDEKALKEKLILCAENNNKILVLNAYWIKSDFVEYRLEYKFEKLKPADPDAAPEYITDDTVVDKSGNKVVSFHNVAVENGHSKEVKLPVVPGFTAVEIISGGDKETSDEGFVEISLSGTTGGRKEIHYKRNKVTIKLDGNGGNWAAEEFTKTLTGKFGASHDHIADPVREDFRFLGWYVKGDSTQTPIKHVDNHTFPAESIEYVAKWEQTMANYTVEFYYETFDSTAANPKYDKTTHIGKGAVGSFPAFNTTPKDVGYTFNDQKRSITAGGKNVNEVTVEGTLVKLYFDRKTITFTLKANGGKFTDGRGNITEELILEGKYGAALPEVDSRGFIVDEPEPPVLEGINDGTASRHDFKFHAWHAHSESAENPGSDLEDELPYTFPAENAIYAARWDQLNGIYKVVHWAESLDGKLLAPKAIDGFSGQMEEGSVTKKGKIGSPMVYFHDSVTGFINPTVEIRNSTGIITGNTDAKKITADEKTEVIVTYLREEYTINFHLNASGDQKAKWVSPDHASGSLETVTRTGKFRTDFTPPADPVREHFVFRGWTTKANGTLNERVDVVPSFTKDAPKDYYAVWYSKASGGLETDTSDISLQWSLDSTKTIIEANAVGNILATGDWSYAWSINDVPVLAGSPGVTFVNNGKGLKLTGCLKKDYEITVVATHNGKVYTKTVIVTVK